MKINIIAIGSLEKDFKILYDEYIRKVGSYTKINLIEIKESKERNIDIKKAKETEQILSKIPKNSPIILCSLQGKMYDSIEFSEIFDKDNLTFIIGGSDGVDESKFENSTKIKFSNMTFPHQLFRVMLSEQIYRAFSIINNKKYHK